MKSIAPTRYDDDGYDEDYPTGTCEDCGAELVWDANGGRWTYPCHCFDQVPEPAPEADETCRTCRFWHNKSGTPGLHACRIHAPQLQDGLATWPKTYPGMWCGEWQSGEGEVA